MDKDSKEIFSCFGIFLFVPLIIVVGAIVGGWAFSTLWGWFIVPVFNLPHLTIAQAVGISVLIGSLKNSSSNSDGKKKETSELISSVLVVLFLPVFSVFLGWIVTLFL